MKIALINASPKPRKSISGILLGRLKPHIADELETVEINLRKPTLTDEITAQLKECEIWVFVFPLYVDGVPGHLLSCLVQIERSKSDYGDKKIYAVMNCGFHEGEQNGNALDMIKNWCVKSDFTWCSGIGIGAGPCMETIAREGSSGGPMRPVDNALKDFAEVISCCNTRDNKYLSVGLPRFIYKTAAQLSWRQKIRANGGKIKDLSKRPKEDN